MSRTTLTAAVAAAAALCAAALTAAVPASATPAAAGTVFVQSDDTAGNTVVAYDRAADGTLTQAGVYPTGGLGGALPGSVVDHLASQGSLHYDTRHQLLYAVNAGSGTLTVFAVHGDRLVLTQRIASGGDFPVSVAAHGDQVFVLNALGGGSIQGYLRVGGRLVAVPAWHRALGLGTDASTPFTGTPGQIGFTPDGTRLVVTTKNATNAVDVFPLGLLGTPAAHPVVSAEPGTVPFAFAFDPAGHLDVVHAGTGSVGVYRVGPDGRLTTLGEAVTGQAASCWITASGGDLYVSNAGSATVTGYRTAPGGTLTDLGETATGAGTVDTAASSDGHFLYAQTGAAGAVDAFRTEPDGTLTRVGSVAVPGGAGGEGIAAS
jgi:6-phosphogluconolactonase (cycloisomerase 2 family)